MGEFEPKEIGLQRTVWLFEREILEKLENTDLKDHHAVLKFNIFSMEYELKPRFDNGRADAIAMRNTANHWFKIWFRAFSACSCEQQSKIESLKNQLTKLGYTDQGGEFMKPPLGDQPNFDLLDSYKEKIEQLEKELRSVHDFKVLFEVEKRLNGRLQGRIKNGIEKIEQCEREGCLFPEWLYWAKKALRGKCE